MVSNCIPLKIEQSNNLQEPLRQSKIHYHLYLKFFLPVQESEEEHLWSRLLPHQVLPRDLRQRNKTGEFQALNPFL